MYKNLILIEDTRNQKTKHKIENYYFEKLGIRVIRSKLFVGDYSLLKNQTICIDTKKDVLEIAGNICNTKKHAELKNECIRAKENGIKLVFLIEEDYDFKSLKLWQSPVYAFGKQKGKPYTKITGETLVKAMQTMAMRYGVDFIFCDKTNSGNKIIEILTKGEL